MNIGDIQALLNNTSTIYTKIDVLPKVAGESIITLTNEDSIKSWTYNDFRNVENQGFIGQFVARTLDGELQDISDDFNIEDREIVLYLGINREHENTLVTQSNVEITNQSGESLITDIGEYETTYYKLGNFFVEKPNSDNVKDSTKYQSTDYTILFNQAFNPDYKSIAFPKSFNERLDDEESVTALWLTQYTCEQVGVELGSTNFDNKDFVLDSNQYDSDYTCRDVIKSIAKLAFTWARIGWDNKLYLDFTKQTQVLDYNIVTNDNYYTLNIQKEVYGEVNRVVTGSSVVVGNSAYVEDAQSIEDNGLTELDVYDNPILYTQELREQAIVAGNKLLGLTYQPIDMETTGHPWLLGNELIKVVDMEGNNLYTYPLDRTITFNGHIKTKINSVTKTQTQTSLAYQGVENESKQVRRSRVELDRQNQKFTVEIENLNNEMQDVTSQVSSVLDTDNTIKGNPISIDDCGEFLIRNIAFYGNLEQDGTPTPDNPIDIDCVEGEHILSVNSKNRLNLNDDVIDMDNGCIMTIENNIVTIEGTSSGYNQVSMGNTFLLPAGKYTVSYIIEGESDEDESISQYDSTYIRLRNVTDNTTIKTFYKIAIDKNGNYTFESDSNSYIQFALSTSRYVTYADFKIKIQIEKGTEVTTYSNVYTEPQEFEYDLGSLQLYKIGNSYDNISYNLTDQKWYITRKIDKLSLYDIYSYGVGLEIKSDNQNTAFIKYPFYTFLQSDDDIVYSEYLQYKGDLKTELSDGLADLALSKGVGLYKSYPNSTNQYIIIVVPNEIATTSNMLLTWLQNNNITAYYTVEQATTEEIQDYDLVEQLNAILEQGKLYETNMIVEDVANDTGTIGDIEVNYLTNTTFNGVYASRAELNITQNSIESTVSETFTTSVQPVIDSVDALGEQLQNTEANLQSNIDDVSNSLGNYALNSSLVTVTNTVSNIQTALNQQILVSKELQENGVTKVTTTTGFTFDENGLAITKTGADTKTVIDEDGMTVYSATGSSETPLLNVDSQGVDTENLHVRTYTQIGNHSRLQDYEDGTAIFYIA